MADVEMQMAASKRESGERRTSSEEVADDALDRMNKALKAALTSPPKPHKDEPKRKRPYKSQSGSRR